MNITAGKRKIGLWEYNRAGIFINLNDEKDKEFIDALNKYMLRTGARASTAIKVLVRQQLIKEGFLNSEAKPKRRT